MLPSSNSTIECIMLWGWIIGVMFEASTPKSHLASITSNPLFIRVALSIVTFCPIDQLGFWSACLTVIFSNSCFFFPLKAPPEAVSKIFFILLWYSPCKHWNIAECSLSTGSIGTLFSFARRVIKSPATTSVSLLDKAMVFFAFIAERVGFNPAKPTKAVNTMSMSSNSTTSSIDFEPAKTLIKVSFKACFTNSYFVWSAITTAFGSNSNACCINKSAFVPAVSTSTANSSLCSLTISKVCVPIDPVEPSKAMCFFFCIVFNKFSLQSYNFFVKWICLYSLLFLVKNIMVFM